MTDGDTHAYSFDIRHNMFDEIMPTGITGPTAAAINNRGDIAGFGTTQPVTHRTGRSSHTCCAPTVTSPC